MNKSTSVAMKQVGHSIAEISRARITTSQINTRKSWETTTRKTSMWSLTVRVVLDWDE
jgi:hypothetical protein